MFKTLSIISIILAAMSIAGLIGYSMPSPSDQSQIDRFVVNCQFPTTAPESQGINRVLGASITPAFPTSLNNFSEGDVIEEEDMNMIEATIGITNSAVATSHDYLIRRGSTGFHKNCGSLSVTYGISSATGTFSGGVTVNASSTFKGYVTADGFTGNASTSDALKANGANCSAGQAPLGVDASGAAESCFDVWTEAENTAADYVGWSQASTTYLTIASTTPVYITSVPNLSITESQVSDLQNYLLVANWDWYGGDTLKPTSTASFLIPKASASSTIVGDFSAGQNTRLFVDSDGYVGIATSTPTEELSVGGDIYITGDYNTSNGEVSDFKEKCFILASSTWQGINTSTDIWYPYHAITIFETICSNGGTATDQGTTTIYFTDGANAMDTMTCGYTTSKDSSLSNNTWTVDETFKWVLQDVTGTPNFMTACIRYYIDRD